MNSVGKFTGTSRKMCQPASLMPDPPPACTPAELAAIEELRAATTKALGGDEGFPELFTAEALLRYSRARSSTAASVKMLLASHAWRREYGLERRLREWREDTSPEAERLRAAWPCGVHGVDHRGCPVYYARYGLIDLAALVRDAGFDRVLALALAEQEKIGDDLLAAAQASGAHPVQVVCVADFDGMSWRRAMRSISPFLALQRVLDDHYPERLHVGFVARAPRLFSGVYKAAEPFLAKDTRAKVRICSASDDHVTALSALVPRESIPHFLGGGSECDIPGAAP